MLRQLSGKQLNQLETQRHLWLGIDLDFKGHPESEEPIVFPSVENASIS